MGIGGHRLELAPLSPSVHGAKGPIVNTNAFSAEVNTGDADRRNRMLQMFMQDVIEDPSLVDLLPGRPEYLDMFERGAGPGREPDFRTPRVDVYLIPRDQLHPNLLIGMDDPLDPA
jgi:hypothetical protein